MRIGLVLLAIPLLAVSALRAQAFDVDFSGYADARVIAPSGQTSWVKGGLGKFRYGDSRGNFRFAEAVGQLDITLDDIADGLSAVTVARLEPDDSSGLDLLEAYALYAPRSDGALSWSVKTGAFFPTISLENDDLGWASSYTLTPSAINSWIGEELRTLGSEAMLHWDSGDYGTFTATGAVLCCNDEAGILMADRGWGMDDRPTGLFERVLMPNATQRIFHAAQNTRSGEFDEIDDRVGWYAGLGWQMAGIGKVTLLRYDNNGDSADKSSRDTAWGTHFWSIGARTQTSSWIFIAQGMAGDTSVVPRPGIFARTKFQSAFLLASYDLDDWRFSARADVFQTRRNGVQPSLFSEDGGAFTGSVSWSGTRWLRLTAEVIAMTSHKGEYAQDGLPPQLTSSQAQFSARFFF